MKNVSFVVQHFPKEDVDCLDHELRGKRGSSLVPTEQLSDTRNSINVGVEITTVFT